LVHIKGGSGLTRSAHGPLTVAIVLLIVSALAALVTNMPLHYEKVTVEEMRSAVNDLWGDDPMDAMQRIAVTHVKEIDSARDRNAWKARFLVAAISIEIIALVPLGLAVFEVIRHPA
jgi:hypothetical protein